MKRKLTEQTDFFVPTERLENYIRENFNLSGEAQRLISNICDYAVCHFSGENLYHFLSRMLDGAIGLTNEEIKKCF